ncbi:hypothetical protein BRADI_4g10410v3 [Brachypodium distachyon]|uniref:Uncharacterized protein n=1 Tax=Brachypodium distachyon TaxID=15368 RepID=I1IJH5_BRADI|nr:hypothetical protein BRADI_4g10410v3 [Brachypodium distachyon]
MAKIIEVALQIKQAVIRKKKIKQAVDTVRQNEEDCVQSGKCVTILSAIVSNLENYDTVRDPVMKALHETLNQVYKLIKDCQEEKKCLINFFNARKMSKQLRQVNDDILAQVVIENFGNNVQNTIMFTKHFHLALKVPLHYLCTHPTGIEIILSLFDI